MTSEVDKREFEKQSGMMNSQEIVGSIRSKGYWRVVIRPTVFQQLRLATTSITRGLIQTCSVHWREWDYPQLNTYTIQNNVDWVESWTDWRYLIEYWRFYLSGQFVHFFAVPEDYIDLDNILPGIPRKGLTPGGRLSFTAMIYTITEIFEFASRLAKEDVLRPAVYISVSLNNVKGYKLTSFIIGRHLDEGYVYTSDNPIVVETEILQQDLVSGREDFAADHIIQIFKHFNWHNASRQMIIEDQKRLRERRI